MEGQPRPDHAMEKLKELAAKRMAVFPWLEEVDAPDGQDGPWLLDFHTHRV